MTQNPIDNKEVKFSPRLYILAVIPATAAGRAGDAAENVGGPNYSNRSGRPRKMRNKFLFRLPFSLPKNHLMFPKPNTPNPKTKIGLFRPDYTY